MVVFWYNAPCIIALMREEVGASETSANFYETARRDVPGEVILASASSCLTVFKYDTLLKLSTTLSVRGDWDPLII
jgi:hypothetical protein